MKRETFSTHIFLKNHTCFPKCTFRWYSKEIMFMLTEEVYGTVRDDVYVAIY